MIAKVKTDKKRTLEKVLPYILIIGSAIGLICAFVILYEKMELLADPSYVPPCSLNPVISCGNVMASAQSHIFGFPNPIIGLAAFPVVITVGMAMLAGAIFKRWFWLGLQAGTTFGVAFITWLAFQSLYRIGALCPFCIAVWSVTIPIFWYTTLYNLRQGHIKLPARLQSVSGFMQRHHGDVLLVWFLILIGAILQRFWYYWSTLI